MTMNTKAYYEQSRSRWIISKLQTIRNIIYYTVLSVLLTLRMGFVYADDDGDDTDDISLNIKIIASHFSRSVQNLGVKSQIDDFI